MAYAEDDLDYIYYKTGGYCACCEMKLARTNYGLNGGKNARGRWEVAHRRARARGGDDNLDNLWPMCISCNRGMGTVDADRWCRG